MSYYQCVRFNAYLAVYLERATINMTLIVLSIMFYRFRRQV